MNARLWQFEQGAWIVRIYEYGDYFMFSLSLFGVIRGDKNRFPSYRLARQAAKKALSKILIEMAGVR